MKCSVTDCPNSALSLGLCSKHYLRQYHYHRLYRILAKQGSWKGKTCEIENCNNPVLCKGICKKHYKAQWDKTNAEYKKQYQKQYKAQYTKRSVCK